MNDTNVGDITFTEKAEQRLLKEKNTKIIENFCKEGGKIFIDGCSGLSDNDIAILAKNVEFLNRKEAKK